MSPISSQPASQLANTFRKSLRTPGAAYRTPQAANRMLLFEKEPNHGNPTMCWRVEYAYPTAFKG
jgi:hypothetical protein